MRRLLAGLLTVLCLLGAAHAASLSPERIAAIDKAAGDFLARAAAAKKSGLVPRQADPAIGPLLDTVLDTRDLSHGALPYADYDRLADWKERIIKVGQVYLYAARQLRDFGIFAVETGRYIDGVVVVLQAMADTMAVAADGHAGALSAAEQKKAAELHTAIVSNLSEIVGKELRVPGVTVDWVQQRLAVLEAAAPSFARTLKPAELARLRAVTIGAAQGVRAKSLKGAFDGLAVALTKPRAPIAAASAPAGAEIALENEGSGYRVTGQINGVTTVKFVVDSGATYVALPQDVVDDMVKAGTVTDADMRGRAVFVIANGKRHRAMLLMLRQLEVGGHVVTNVMASVLPAHAHALLGLSFLAKFKSWTLDTQRHVLAVVE